MEKRKISSDEEIDAKRLKTKSFNDNDYFSIFWISQANLRTEILKYLSISCRCMLYSCSNAFRNTRDKYSMGFSLSVVVDDCLNRGYFFLYDWLMKPIKTSLEKLRSGHISLKYIKSDIVQKSYQMRDFEKQCEIITPYYKLNDTTLFSNCSSHQNIQLMKWAISNNYAIRLLKCTTFIKVFNYKSTEENSITMVTIARMNGCHWNEDTCDEAIKHGYFKLLKMLREYNCPWTQSCWKIAALKDKLEILKWILENGITIDKNDLNEEFFANLVANFVSIEMLQFIKNLGCKWDKSAYSHPFDCDNFGPTKETLEWLYDNGCPLNETLCYIAAYHGDLETMQWTVSKGFVLDIETMINAAKWGEEHILKWLRDNNCPWDEKAIEGAIKNHNWHTVKWLKENNYPWITPEIEKGLKNYMDNDSD